MPYRRKDSAVWWASYTDASGNRVRKSTGSTDEGKAEYIERKWREAAKTKEGVLIEAARTSNSREDDLSRDDLIYHKVNEFTHAASETVFGDYTFDQLMLAYLEATETKRSHQRDINAARHLRNYFAGRNLSELRRKDVRGYIENRQRYVKPGTINRELCLLSAAINYARLEWEWEISNPVSGRKLREPEGRARHITRAEAQLLMREAEREPNAVHLVDFIQLALNTGCRKQELLGLEWRRVDLQRDLIFLEGVNTKSGKRRSVPLNQAARSAILHRAQFQSKYCPDSLWVFAHKDGRRVGDIKRSFSTACRRAGIEDFRIHDLRHTCAAWLVTAGVPLTEVRDLLGHSSIKMTERYAHLAPENVRAAVALLDGHPSRFGHGESARNGAIIRR